MRISTDLPSSFIALPVIQEELQEVICGHCEYHILEQSSNSYHFQCEGRFCEQAHESFKDLNETVEYSFVYTPSKEVMEMEERLNRRLHRIANKLFSDHVRISLISLVFRTVIKRL